MRDPLRRDAAARIRRIGNLTRIAREQGAGPAAWADLRTSLCDARIALCIALGVPLEEIDPASGYSLTRAAYEDVRASWRHEAGQRAACGQGPSDWFECNLAEARAWWAARRPDLTDGDDWLAGLLKPEPEGDRP